MFDRLESSEKRYEELSRLIAQPDVATNPVRLQALARERAGFETAVTAYREYKAVSEALERTRAMLNDEPEAEIVALAKDEIANLKQRQDQLLRELRLSLLPRDPNDDRNVIVEVRAGTGGTEAALFAADLFRMYNRYAQTKGWQTEIIDSSRSEIGGFREIVFEVKGTGAFSKLKYERGVHRVQRVPITEASGRIHTSTATVAVLPEVEEIEIDINSDDLKLEFFHSHGAGGQNVNKVTTAVRLTHLPTGIVASCQDERSQLRNRTKAMAVLRARLFDMEQRKQLEDITKERRSQVGSGQRAEKIRTYNFPQDRVTDHHINLTLHGLAQILDGDLDRIIDSLIANEQIGQLEGSLR